MRMRYTILRCTNIKNTKILNMYKCVVHTKICTDEIYPLYGIVIDPLTGKYYLLDPLIIQYYLLDPLIIQYYRDGSRVPREVKGS